MTRAPSARLWVACRRAAEIWRSLMPPGERMSRLSLALPQRHRCRSKSRQLCRRAYQIIQIQLIKLRTAPTRKSRTIVRRIQSTRWGGSRKNAARRQLVLIFRIKYGGFHHSMRSFQRCVRVKAVLWKSHKLSYYLLGRLSPKKIHARSTILPKSDSRGL